MQTKKEIIKAILIIFLVTNLMSYTDAKFFQIVDGKGVASIAKPIIEVEKEEEKIVGAYLGMEEAIYNFSIKNYKEELVSDVDFLYVISIERKNNNFPIECSLYTADGEEIKLINNKTDTLLLEGKKKLKNDYILKIKWKNADGKLAATDEIQIKIEAIQNSIKNEV